MQEGLWCHVLRQTCGNLFYLGSLSGSSGPEMRRRIKKASETFRRLWRVMGNEGIAINEYLRKIEQSRFEKMLKSYADGDFSRRLDTLSICSTESDNILTPRNLNDREHPLRGSV